jgi:hypothetical protein
VENNCGHLTRVLREDVRGRSNNQKPMPDLRFGCAALVCGLARTETGPGEARSGFTSSSSLSFSSLSSLP